MSEDEKNDIDRTEPSLLAPEAEIHSKLDDLPPIKRRLPLWAKILIMAAIVFLGGIETLRTHFHQDTQTDGTVQENDKGDDESDGGEGVGEIPPVAKRKALADILLTADAGANKHLSDFKGKVVILSFWASWCTPCLIELPSFIDLYNKLGDKGLVILPIDVDEPDVAAQAVPHFWKTKGFPFPTFFDPDHKISDQMKIDVLPSNFVVDRAGRQVAQSFGENDWGSDSTMSFIRQLLDEK